MIRMHFVKRLFIIAPLAGGGSSRMENFDGQDVELCANAKAVRIRSSPNLARNKPFLVDDATKDKVGSTLHAV